MARSVTEISEQLRDERHIFKVLEDQAAYLDEQLQNADTGDTPTLRDAKNRNRGLREHQWHRICALGLEMSEQGQPLDMILGRPDNYPLRFPENLETKKMKSLRQQAHDLTGPHRAGDMATKSSIASDRAGPRLTVFSPTTGQQFTTVRKGERVAAEDCPVGLGDFIVGCLNGGWNHIASPEIRAQALRLAQEAGSLATGGVFIGQEIWPRHLDAIRSRAKCFEAGMQTILVDDMPVGSLRVTQTVSGPTPQWLGELNAATASAISFRALNLVPAKLATYVPVSRELLADSVNAAPAIEQAILGAMAAEIDRACLLGSGAGVELQGVANHPDVQTVASVGTPTDFAEIISALRSVYTAGYDGDASGLAWLYSPREMASYGALCDLQGQPLNEPRLVADLQHLVASALPTNEGGGAESRMVVGPFDQSILFVRQRPQIEVLREGSITDSNGATLNATSQDAVVLRCTMRVALAVLRPTWFAVLSGVTST